jgi:hypothetical protein
MMGRYVTIEKARLLFVKSTDIKCNQNLFYPYESHL